MCKNWIPSSFWCANDWMTAVLGIRLQTFAVVSEPVGMQVCSFLQILWRIDACIPFPYTECNLPDERRFFRNLCELDPGANEGIVIRNRYR